MNIKLSWSIKTLVIIISLLLINLVILTNYEHALATELSNDDLTPELNSYWEYRRQDFSDNSIYRYNLTVSGEKTIKVANMDVKVLILEGYGEIIQWPNDIIPSDFNEIYIKKEVRKENLELIRYTERITLGNIIEGEHVSSYTQNIITYNYVDFTKPESITIGSNWTKNVIRTQERENKLSGEDPEKFVHQDEINSTILCDSIKSTIVDAGTYKTFVVLERQWHGDIEDTEVWYYYSKQAKGYVKKERRNFTDDLVEIEELIEFKEGTPDNGNNHDNNESNDGADSPWFDLNDRNVQISLGVIFILIACVIFGYIGYRKFK
jgi:hypothetical protein